MTVAENGQKAYSEYPRATESRLSPPLNRQQGLTARRDGNLFARKGTTSTLTFGPGGGSDKPAGYFLRRKCLSFP